MTNQESFICSQVKTGCINEFMSIKSSQDAAMQAVDDYKKHKLGGGKPLDLIVDAITKAKKVNKKEIQLNKRR